MPALPSAALTTDTRHSPRHGKPDKSGWTVMPKSLQHLMHLGCQKGMNLDTDILQPALPFISQGTA